MKDKRESNRELLHAFEHFEKCQMSFLLGFSILKRMNEKEAKKRRKTDEAMEEINKVMEGKEQT